MGMPGGGVKWNWAGGMEGLSASPGEGETGECAVGFFNLNRCNCSIRRDGKGEPGYALLLTFGLAGEGELAAGRGGEAEVEEFFFKLGVAKEKAERGAQVVEVAAGNALDLGVAAGVEPGELAVKEEDFTGR